MSGYWTLLRVFNDLTALFTQKVCLNTPILNLQSDFFLRVELWKRAESSRELARPTSGLGPKNVVAPRPRAAFNLLLAANRANAVANGGTHLR